MAKLNVADWTTELLAAIRKNDMKALNKLVEQGRSFGMKYSEMVQRSKLDVDEWESLMYELDELDTTNSL